MKVNNGMIVISLLILSVFTVNISSAATVEVTTGKLPAQLQEGQQVDLTIKIKDYQDAGKLTLETDINPSTDRPLWNFGDSEPIINANRYQQKIVLDNLSSLPAILSVSISGKVPEGVDKVKCGDTVLNKMHETTLKFYEVRSDEKLAKIESFELLIKVKDDFEKTLQQIRRKEFDGMKTEARKIFNIGLTTEAQNIANEMNNLKWPDNMMLLGVIKITDEMAINVIFIISIMMVFIIGYSLGSRGSDEDDGL